MRTISVGAKLPAIFLALVTACTLCSLLAGQQHSRRPISEVRPYTSVDDILDREARASDLAGIHQYSEDLIAMLVPDQAGEGYIESLANRLTKAEQTAREKNGKLISEAKIAQVFNDLMRQVGAPPSFKADEVTIRRFRTHSIAVPSLPALLSANRNGGYCNPGEAVYLLYLLLSNNGDLPDHVLDDEAALKHAEALSPRAEGTVPKRTFVGSVGQLDRNGSWFVSDYSMHHRRATIKLFNGIAQAFGF